MFGLPDFGWVGVIWNFKDKTGPLQQDHLPAVLPPGDGDAGRRAGDHRRASTTAPRGRPTARSRRSRRRRTRRRTRSSRLPLQPGQGGGDPEGPRLERRAQRPDDLRQRRAADPDRVRRRHPQGDADLVHVGTPRRRPRVRIVRAHRRGGHLRGQAGRRDQHPAAARRRSTTSPRNYNDADPRARSTSTTGASTTSAASPTTLPDAELDLQHRRLVQQRRLHTTRRWTS